LPTTGKNGLSQKTCIKNEFLQSPLLIPVKQRIQAAKSLMQFRECSSMCPIPTASAHLPDGLILVVEDDPLILEFLCEILQEEGFKVEPRTSADDAKLYLEEHAPEVALLLTDITMPGEINGAGLANLVGERWPDKPVMVMSGYETPETSGVKHPVAFIKKPWAIGQLLDCVDSAFKSKAPRLH
jgi:CheY-like chemotaxis protein